MQQSKMEWMLQELNNDGFYPTEQAVQRILDGNAPDCFEDALVDYVLELDAERND